MVELASFDARNDAIASGDDSSSISNYAWWETALILDALDRLFSKFKASLYQRKLDRVLRQWPGSLLCTHCGRTEKRR
jgi:hypothetical protein